MDKLNQLHLEMIQYYAGDAPRIQHFCKVHAYGKLIGETEGLPGEELFILEAAALTHDIGIHICEEKYGNCDGSLQEKEGPAIAEEMLGRLGFGAEVIERVCYLIGHHHSYGNMDGMDYQILVEADFLVNLQEGNADREMIESVLEKIFRTETGKKLCAEMFGVR